MGSPSRVEVYMKEFEALFVQGLGIDVAWAGARDGCVCLVDAGRRQGALLRTDHPCLISDFFLT